MTYMNVLFITLIDIVTSFFRDIDLLYHLIMFYITTFSLSLSSSLSAL